MKDIRYVQLKLLGSAMLIFSFTQPVSGQSLMADQLRTPAEGSPERKAILDAVRQEYKARISSSSQGDPIQTIREQYATINKSAARYKSVKKDLSGFSAEGGTLVAYFDGPKLMKIVASHYGESGKAVEEYYYWDDQLIFVYRKDSNYDKPGSQKVVRTAENRFYFSNDRLVRWLDKNAKQIEPGDSEYLEKEKDYLRLSKEFTDGARSKKSIIESVQ
jgi:hypothetical protein